MNIQLLQKHPIWLRNKEVLNGFRPVLAGNGLAMNAMGSGDARNATLRHEEWLQVDDAVNDVLRERLTIADDLRARGLSVPISVGSVLRMTERLEDFDDADLSYDGATPPSEDRPSYLNETTAVPVISKGFRFNWRQLIASRERGEPLDVTSAQICARKVRDKLQDLITNGEATGGPTGGGIPGLTSATNRITVNLANHWDVAAGTPIADTESMLAAAYNVNLFGPFTMYVCKEYWAAIQADYKDESDKTVMQRIEAFSDIDAVRPLDTLADNTVLLVQMTSQALDLSEAQGVTTVQWTLEPMVTHFRVFYVGGPHIKSIEDEDGNTRNGIVHLRPSP